MSTEDEAMTISEEVVHSWAETRNLCPVDSFLRRHGFTIHARPKGQDPQWAYSRKERDGKIVREVVEQRIALVMAKGIERRKKEEKS